MGKIGLLRFWEGRRVWVLIIWFRCLIWCLIYLPELNYVQKQLNLIDFIEFWSWENNGFFLIFWANSINFRFSFIFVSLNMQFSWIIWLFFWERPITVKIYFFFFWWIARSFAASILLQYGAKSYLWGKWALLPTWGWLILNCFSS